MLKIVYFKALFTASKEAQKISKAHKLKTTLPFRQKASLPPRSLALACASIKHPD